MNNVKIYTAFFKLLREIDEEFAKSIKDKGCPKCGDVLDVSNYPRKPRGIELLEDGSDIRFSFCCRNDSCRQRVTPPSLRFLGRKVYIALIIILSQTSEYARAGGSPSRQTLARWKNYWLEVCGVTSEFYQSKISLFVAGFYFQVANVVAFFVSQCLVLADAWLSCLKFFSCLSTKEYICKDVSWPVTRDFAKQFDGS